MRWDRSATYAVIPAAFVAVIAGVVSYSHIVDLALSSGQSPADAHLYPFAVDGLVISGVVILLAGSPLGWLCAAPGIGGTVYANVMSGIAHGPVAATIAAWPAVAFALASFTLERWLKSRAKPRFTTDADCGHGVAGTLDEAIVATYLHGRDCLGEAPSQRHLADAFGASRPRVAGLVGPLNGHHTPETLELREMPA